jgi:hypothetical protein
MSPAAAIRIAVVSVRVVKATSALVARPAGDEITTCAWYPTEAESDDTTTGTECGALPASTGTGLLV